LNIKKKLLATVNMKKNDIYYGSNLLNCIKKNAINH